MEDPLNSLMETMQLHFQSPISQHHHMRRRTKSRRSTKSLTDLDVKAILRSMTEDQREHHFKNFRPSYLKLRSIVAEWILDLGEYFDLHTTTSHAAISYLDRIQPNEKFCTFQWQMVAICCITIAAKYNEMEEDVPDLHSLGGIIEQDIPYNVALDYELWVLKQMGWKLNARTPLAFLSCYTCIGVVCPSEISALNLHLGLGLGGGGGGMEFKEINAMVIKHASILANLCILDMQFKAYPASLVAAAILFLARKNVGLLEPWRPELSSLTTSDPVSFLHIVKELEIAASHILSRLHHITVQRQQQQRHQQQLRQQQQQQQPMHDVCIGRPLSMKTGGASASAGGGGGAAVAAGGGSPVDHHHITITPEQPKGDKKDSSLLAQNKPSPASVADMLCS